MKNRVLLSVALSLILLMALALVVGAKLPSGYENTRGLYVFFDVPEEGYDPPVFPAKGGFWRYNWSALEPSNGVPSWGGLDNWVQREQAHGKYAGIGFSFYNPVDGTGSDVGLQAPAWLWGLDSDVRWLNTQRNPPNYLPNYWNNTFRTYYTRFINSFAQHLVDNPDIRVRVAWVSIGCGLSGETQPGDHWVGGQPLGPDYKYYHDVKGITSAQWVEYVNWCSYTYKQAFLSRGLNTPIVLDIGPTYMGGTERNDFSSYAKSQGVGIRNNGLKMDREASIYGQMKDPAYYNNVPTTWETYGTPGWLDSRQSLFWGMLCGLSKHPDNFTLDKVLWSTEEYRPILEFAARYSGVTASTSPGAWVGLRQTQTGGEAGNYNLYLTQKDDAPSGRTTAVWSVGADRRYRFDGVPSGNCTVELHFAEIYPGYSAGSRIIDIFVEGQLVENNFDPVVAAGGVNRAVLRAYTVPVLDGQLEFRLDPDWAAGSDDYPILSAIKVTGPSGYERRVNCGGATYTDHANKVWTFDREYEPGSYGYIGGTKYGDNVDIVNSIEDPLYQTLRKFEAGAPAWGRFARRTDQASGNTRMRFDIDAAYLASGFNGTAVITVTYCMSGTDYWQLRYDSAGGVDKAATPYGSSEDRVHKDGTKTWRQAVFYLTDARFTNSQPGTTDFSIDCMSDGDEYVSFVEVSKGGGSGPSNATLNGHVTLQRPSKPAPDPSWQTSLVVTIGGTDHSVNTDQSGYFSVAGLAPSTYNIKVKGSHTLGNLKNGVTLAAGANSVEFGTLLEGDANNDNCVDILDFSLLRTVFAPNYDARADFNQDGAVDILDFSLLRTSFGQCGDLTVLSPPQASGLALETGVNAASAGVVVAIEPHVSVVTAGDVFTVSVRVDAAGQPVDGAEVHLNYDPARLRVVDEGAQPADHIESSGVLDVLLRNRVDNAAGTIDYAAGTFSAAPPSGGFELATIRLMALNAGPTTPLVFVRAPPRKTNVVFAGASVLGGTGDGLVTSGLTNVVYLPSVARQ